MPKGFPRSLNTGKIARNLHTLAGAFQELAEEADLLSNMPDIDPLTSLLMAFEQHEWLHKLQKDTQELRKDLEQNEKMSAIRIHNSKLNGWSPIRYPPGISASSSMLPETSRELFEMSSVRCQNSAAQLGPSSLSGPVCVAARRRQVADYLGVTE